MAPAASPSLRRRFPPEIIAQCVLLSMRFPLSLRAVEEKMLLRGVQVSYGTIRRRRQTLGQQVATELRRRRPKPEDTGRLNEVFLTINGQTSSLWRAVDQEGNVRDVLVQSRPERGGSQAPDAHTDDDVAVCAPGADHGQAPELWSSTPSPVAWMSSYID